MKVKDFEPSLQFSNVLYLLTFFPAKNVLTTQLILRGKRWAVSICNWERWREISAALFFHVRDVHSSINADRCKMRKFDGEKTRPLLSSSKILRS